MLESLLVIACRDMAAELQSASNTSNSKVVAHITLEIRALHTLGGFVC